MLTALWACITALQNCQGRLFYLPLGINRRPLRGKPLTILLRQSAVKKAVRHTGGFGDRTRQRRRGRRVLRNVFGVERQKVFATPFQARTRRT